MSPEASTTIPVASRATHSAVARRNRRVRPGMVRAITTTARNDRPSPVAAMSCSSTLTERGMRPITVRWVPADATAVRNAREVRRPVPAGSARPTKTPYTARKKPAKSIVELKTLLEASPKVPSCEKWRCHQFGSVVVTIETSTPIGRDTTAIRLIRCTEAARSMKTATATGAGATISQAGARPRVAATSVATGASERVVGGMRLTIGSIRGEPPESGRPPSRAPRRDPPFDNKSPVQRRAAQ